MRTLLLEEGVDDSIEACRLLASKGIMFVEEQAHGEELGGILPILRIDDLPGGLTGFWEGIEKIEHFVANWPQSESSPVETSHGTN